MERDRLLGELRARGARGVLYGELRRVGITGIGAHIESLRLEPTIVLEQRAADGLDGQRDTRYTLLSEATRQTSSEKAPAASEEPPVQELLASATARTETCGEATP